MNFQLYQSTLELLGNLHMEKWDIYALSNPLRFRILTDHIEDDDDSQRSYPTEIPFFKVNFVEDNIWFRSLM